MLVGFTDKLQHQHPTETVVYLCVFLVFQFAPSVRSRFARIAPQLVYLDPTTLICHIIYYSRLYSKVQTVPEFYT